MIFARVVEDGRLNAFGCWIANSVTAMRFGAKLIRPLLVVVCLALAIKLLWQ